MSKSISTSKRKRIFAIGSFSIVAGLLAVWAAHEHIHMRELELEKHAVEQMLERIVVTADLKVGTTINDDHLAIRSIPQQWVPGASFEERDAERVVGQRLTVDLQHGDIVLETHLSSPQEPLLSERVPKGRRALTVPVSDIQAAVGVLGVNDLIDLYVSFSYQGQQVTAPLAQGVRILSLSANGEPAVITLEVSEHDAVKVVAARRTGVLTAMLRHRDDSDDSKIIHPGGLAALMGLDKGSPVLPSVIPILYGDRITDDMIGGESDSAEEVSNHHASMLNRGVASSIGPRFGEPK